MDMSELRMGAEGDRLPPEGQLAELIEVITGRIQAGEEVRDADLVAAYPEFKRELEGLLPVVRGLVLDADSATITLPPSGEVSVEGIGPSVVLGDFRILRELGRGGMGVVYEAEQISLGRRVALKALPAFDALDSRRFRRFQSEARAAAMLDHQHIVRVHGVGFDRGVHFYAMQLVVGTDLQRVIRTLRAASSSPKSAEVNRLDETSRPADTPVRTCDPSALFGLSDSRATPANQRYVKTFARLGIQAAEALHHAHEMGIVHRDIKPSNLLLDTESNIRIADFGLAQIKGEPGITVTGDWVGTLRYMSPEQAYAKRVVVDHRTDIYSLGVTLYELLTLHPLFERARGTELMRKIAFEDPRPPRRINKRIPVELETIVLKAMSKSPDQRYQTARELADDLRRFDNNEPIRARPPGPLDYAKKWSSRHKPLVGSIAVGLIICFLAAIVSSGLIWSALVETEAERKQTSQMWRKAEGLRLAALSALTRPSNPGLGFALAIEGLKLHPTRELVNALLAAFEANHEHRTLLDSKSLIGSISFDTRGEKLITTVHRTQFSLTAEPARIWDLATGRLLVELKPHPVPLTSAVFSPGGVRILATSAPIGADAAKVDGSDPRHAATIWDSLTGKKLLTLNGSFLLETHVGTFNPHGQRVVLPATDNLAKVWDVIEGNVIVTLSGHNRRVIFATFDALGERIATVSEDQTVRIWRAEDGQLLTRLGPDNHLARSPVRAAFSPDGTLLVTEGGEGELQLWDPGTGEVKSQEPWPGDSPRFTPDGSRIAFTRYLNTQVRRARDGEVLHELRGRLVALSPDGTLVATAEGTQVMIWNLETGAVRAELLGHRNELTAAEFDPSSRYLATASFDQTARLWHVQSGAERLSFAPRLQRDLAIIAETPDAARIAIAPAPEIRTQIIDLDADQAVLDVPGTVWHPDVRGGRLLTTTSHRAEVFESEGGQPVHTFEVPNEEILIAQLSPDGKHALIATNGGPAWLWHLEPNERVQIGGPRAAVLELDWSPQSDFVVTAAADGTARAWNTQTGQQQQLLKHPHSLQYVRLHAEGNRLAAVLENSQVLLWNLASGELIGEFSPPQGITLSRVEFSGDGERLFAFREDLSQGVVCWDLESGELVGSLAPIRGRVRLAVSPAGTKCVIASSVDGAMLWEPDGERRKMLTTSATAYGVFLTEDRVVLATLGLNQHPESLPIEERRRYATPSLQLRDASDGRLLEETTLPIGLVSWLGLVPHSTHVLVSGAFFGAALYDAQSHDRLASLRGHSAPISFIGFADDGVVTTSWDGTAAIWDRESGALRRRLQADGAIVAAAISANARQLAAGDAVGNVHTWTIPQDQPRVDLKPHEDLVRIVQFRPGSDGELLTSSLDKSTSLHQLGTDVTKTVTSNGVVARQVAYADDGQVWLLVPGRLTYIQSEFPSAIEFRAAAPEAPDHRVLVYGTDLKLRTYDAKSVPVFARFRFHHRQLVTIAERHIIVWDLNEHRPIREIPLPGDGVTAGDVSLDGKYALTQHRERVALWDLDTGSEIMTLTPSRANDEFRNSHFNPTGEHLLTIMGRQLRAYPVQVKALIEQRPRSLLPSERSLYGILENKDWPKL